MKASSGGDAREREGATARALCEVVVTRSGAPAMRDCVTGELMHPVVGPLIEADELYVKPARLSERLEDDSRSPLVLLDVGLGAGSNALAAWRASEARSASGRGGRVLEIVSFDRSLAALELASSNDHAQAFGLDGDAGRAARSLMDQGHHETPLTRWRLMLGELPATLADEPSAFADIIFWDPFSPRKNPDLWNVSAFSKLRRLCRAGATVHTYSGATAVRAALLLAGFAVASGGARGSGEGAKDATTAAVDIADLKSPLDRRWLERLGRSSAPFPADAPDDALGAIALLPQFVT